MLHDFQWVDPFCHTMAMRLHNQTDRSEVVRFLVVVDLERPFDDRVSGRDLWKSRTARYTVQDGHRMTLT